MGKATNWSKFISIGDDPEFWKFKDEKNDPAQPSPQYNAPPSDTCSRYVTITYIGQILNTYNSGFIYLDRQPPDARGLVNYMFVDFISEEDWRNCKYKWIMAKFGGD